MSQKTSIMSNDLISTMQYLGILKYWKGKHVITVQQVGKFIIIYSSSLFIVPLFCSICEISSHLHFKQCGIKEVEVIIFFILVCRSKDFSICDPQSYICLCYNISYIQLKQSNYHDCTLYNTILQCFKTDVVDAT